MKLYIYSLNFWFCNNPGLFLPIVALKKQVGKFNLAPRSVEKLFNSNTTITYTNTKPNVKLWCDYIFLDKDEKIEITN